jgi:glycosyltransferase involved in cell wall biosynthesis
MANEDAGCGLVSTMLRRTDNHDRYALVNHENPSNMLISVITICMNAVEYIEQTITSVIDQTYPNLEYIIIDGGSTDGTLEIIRKYEHRLAYWHSKPDRGIAHAFNLGLAQAHGDWIVFLNADDFFLAPTVIEHMVPHLRLHKDDDVVFGNFLSLTREKNPKPVPLCKSRGRPWRWQEFRRIDRIPHLAAFTNRHYFDRVGKFDDTFRIAMDYDLFLRASEGLRAQFVPLTIAGMRTGGECVKNIYNTLHESKRAQIKNQSLPRWMIEVNFLLRVGRLYLGILAHRVMDPLASKIHWPGRN